MGKYVLIISIIFAFAVFAQSTKTIDKDIARPPSQDVAAKSKDGSTAAHSQGNSTSGTFGQAKFSTSKGERNEKPVLFEGEGEFVNGSAVIAFDSVEIGKNTHYEVLIQPLDENVRWWVFEAKGNKVTIKCADEKTEKRFSFKIKIFVAEKP